MTPYTKRPRRVMGSTAPRPNQEEVLAPDG
jgi:hypothetical protein